MDKTKLIRLSAVGVLLAGGTLIAGRAYAGSGSCNCPSGTVSEGYTWIHWGDSYYFSGDGQQSWVITGGTYNGMYVNLGSNTFACIQGESWINDGTFLCANHDATNDGNSVSDTSGDCYAPNQTVDVQVAGWSWSSQCS